MDIKKAREKLEWLNEIVNEDIEFDNDKEKLVLGFIFNILTSNTVLNRYEFTRYGKIIEDKDIGIKECINYIGKKWRNKVG